MATIYIDDQVYNVEDGANVLEAALNAGLDLPYFCWHPAMGSVGACRQCAIVQFRDEEDTRGRIVMGCMTAVTDGARFSMQGDTASQFRENIVESLMLNHPHDCPVCAEGGECHLQDMTVMVGHRDRRYRGKKNTHQNQNLGPLINHEMNRCIACYRCTRFYQDYAGGKDLAAHAAHDHVYFGRHQEGTLESEFAGNLVEVCPTGVFTDKPLVNDYTRKWDMQSAPSICGGCAVGCNTIPGERYGELKRVHNRYNNEVNGYFLCDRGRYGHSYVNDESRPRFAGLRDKNNKFNAVEDELAVSTLAQWIADGNTMAIGSPRASLESNYLLQSLVGTQNFCLGLSDDEAALLSDVHNIVQHTSVTIPSLKQIESADAVFVLGEDVTNTAPRTALALRQSVRNRAKTLAQDARIPTWQDEAVRTLAQDQLSPLYIASVTNTPLDDVAQGVNHDDPDGIARFGFAVAAEIDNSLPAVNDLSDEQRELVKDIAHSLKSARRPLLVSGTGCNSNVVVQAASTIAHALQQQGSDNTMLCYCLAEANTMGVAMLASSDTPSMSSLVANRNEISTLIVLENDLYRRGQQTEINALLASAKRLVVMDALPNSTMEQANLMLPAATLIESEGTFVSSEGRAQRHYPVFLASDQRAPAWQWITRLGKHLEQDHFKSIKYFDDVTQACADTHPNLATIVDAAPKADFRNRGLKIPRQPHRYSGRTAMRANISVHEPKQAEDAGTPLSYSMEGSNGSQPGALLPFVWSPGWNSNQSLHKFQSEIGGELTGGTNGQRLFESNAIAPKFGDYEIPTGSSLNDNEYLIVPVQRIFGTDELSAKCDAISELNSLPFIQINPKDAQRLAVNSGDLVNASIGSERVELKIELNNAIKTGCAGVGIGLAGMPFVAAGAQCTLKKLTAKANNAQGQDV